MIVNMLKAVSKMISDSKEPKVLCAHIMLDEIIKGMSDKDTVIKVEPEKQIPTDVVLDEPKKPEKSPPTFSEEAPKIMVDDEGKLLPIAGFPDNSLLKLDGKVMEHKAAVGKTFTTIERVD